MFVCLQWLIESIGVKCTSIVPSFCKSFFRRAYNDKCHKSTYWEHTYEDAMNLIAKLPTVAAIIYRNLYRDGTSVGAIDEEKDWSWNYTDMMGILKEKNVFFETFQKRGTVRRGDLGQAISKVNSISI